MENKKGYIDINLIIKTILKRKKLFIITIPTSLVLAFLLILGVPRSYSTSSMLVPETDNPTNGGSLSSLASSFGIDLSQAGTTDAISPLLYPSLLEDDGFITSLFNIKIKSADGLINCTYYDYYKKYQKVAWWTKAMGGIKKLFASKDTEIGKAKKFNPYYLSKRDYDIADAIRGSISLGVDKKTGVITISTTAQDPLICKVLADSITMRLQGFITEYRTKKSRRDVEYYTNLAKKAKADYEKSRQLYGSYADANADIILESFKSKQEDLENDMQLKFNTYSALNTQLQAAKAKLQERTPAFTLLQGASVPQKPSKPKRLLFVLAIGFLTFIFDLGYIVAKEQKNILI